VDGRRRPQTPARPQQGGRLAVHRQRVLGSGVIRQECAHAERPQASTHMARCHISGMCLSPNPPNSMYAYNICIDGCFIIVQFLWRLGTVGARVISLTAYAAMYKYWVLLVLGLHWLSMLLWLHSPKNVFHGERMSPKRKAFLFALLAFVFTFEYVNLLENNHREKMVST